MLYCPPASRWAKPADEKQIVALESDVASYSTWFRGDNLTIQSADILNAYPQQRSNF